MLDLIYCAGNNKKLSLIAQEEGWLLGMRSDSTSTEFEQTFIDVNYKKIDFERHLEVVKTYRPKYASVPDLSDKVVCQDDIDRALSQAERLAPYCEIVLIVPKLSGQIERLPPNIAIGYSVPSSYGGAQYPIWELAGRRVHLLGGSPQKQMQAYLHIAAIADVTSADGSTAKKMATQFAKFWQNGRWVTHPQRNTNTSDLYFDCWRRSCRNIIDEWKKIS